MQTLYVIIGLLMISFYYYESIQFAKKILSNTRKDKLDCIIIAIINSISHYVMFQLNIPFEIKLIFTTLILLIEFSLISKTSFRQVVFGASVFGFNIAAVNVLTFVTFSYISGVSGDVIGKSESLYFIAKAITCAILLLMTKAIEVLVPFDKLKAISFTKVYSEVVSITAILMMIYLCISSWIIFSSDAVYIQYFLSIIINITTMGVAFYCLFFFNVRLINLHSFKRKSDKAEQIRQKNIEKHSIAQRKLYTDELTDVYNKLFIEEKLNEYAMQTDFDFGVVYSDLAGLKYVNDNFGHKNGDKYIISAANAFKKSVRDDDFVARIGGDEFLILLYDITESHLDLIIQRIKENIEIQNEKADFNIHANIGYHLVQTTKTNRDISEIIQKADILMQEDKREYYAKGGAGI